MVYINIARGVAPDLVEVCLCPWRCGNVLTPWSLEVLVY